MIIPAVIFLWSLYPFFLIAKPKIADATGRGVGKKKSHISFVDRPFLSVANEISANAIKIDSSEATNSKSDTVFSFLLAGDTVITEGLVYIYEIKAEFSFSSSFLIIYNCPPN